MITLNQNRKKRQVLLMGRPRSSLSLVPEKP